ncbi:MAG: serine/threonine-protein kinase [Planctomycetota bacterium]
MTAGEQQRGLLGRALGNYKIIRTIGKGGGGAVYLARATEAGPAGSAGTVVALKVFHPELTTDENILRRFQREAELGIKIRHEHVVETYEVGVEEIDGLPHHFMVMEFVEGETLRDTIQELGVMPEHLLYQVADQILDALGAVHAEGMIHRDVKPENIVLTRDHQVRVMDLGIARLQQEGRDLTRADEFVGSLSYAAPEQFMDQDHVDPRADIYALGVLLYELATGYNPFGQPDLQSLLGLKFSGQLRRPKSINRDLDPFLDEVILTCAQKEPDARFASCEELRAVLREGEASAWWAARIEGDAFPAATRALRALRPPRDASIVGRDAEFARLHEAFERACGGAGTVALVCGTAGAGKSRLVHDFLEELMAPDGPFIWAGRCPEGEARSFHPFREAAHGFYGEDKFGAHEDLADVYTEAVRERAAERPLVLVLEDMNRADPKTVELFGHLARTLVDAPVLLIATYRLDEVEEGTDFHALAAALSQREGTASIELGGLEREAVDEIIKALVKKTSTVRALSWPLYSASEGNPYFLFEILAHLKEAGALTEADDGASAELASPIHEVDVPTSVRGLLGMRLEKLDDELKATLEAAAVQGPEFDASLLSAVTGQKRIRLQKRLAVLERNHRLVVSSGKRAFRFASHGLHAVVYAGMSEEVRAQQHSLCADAIGDEEGDWDGERSYAWVRHMLRAGRLAEAGEHVVAATEHAAAHYHSSEAAAFLTRVLDALAPEVHRLRYSVLMRMAAVQHLLGRSESQRETLGRAAAEAEASEDAETRTRVLAAMATASFQAGHYDQAEDEAQRGLADEGGDALGKARCLHTLGVVEFRRGEFGRCVEYLRAALELQRECDDRRGEATTLLQLGAALPEIGEGGQALEMKQSALTILRELGDRRGEGAALNNLGNTYVDVERIPEALVCYERSIQIARALGDLPTQASALYNMGCVYTAEERIDDAQDVLERALDIFRELEDPSGEANVLDELGSALASFGELKEARRYLKEALAAAERTGENAVRARVLRHLGTVHVEAGERDKAWQLYESALGLARSRTRSAILSDMGRAAERDGDYDRAVQLLEESLADNAKPATRLLSLCRLARAHHAAGRVEDALASARRAEEMMQDDEGVAPTYGPEIFFSLGTVLADQESGRGYLGRAKALVDARTRSIRSIVYRQHYLTTHWPSREILEEARQFTAAQSVSD